MSTRRGYPDRRGMGAQSDFISEPFVPSERHKEEQVARAKVLISHGFPVERVAGMVGLSASEILETLLARKD